MPSLFPFVSVRGGKLAAAEMSSPAWRDIVTEVEVDGTHADHSDFPVEISLCVSNGPTSGEIGHDEAHVGTGVEIFVGVDGSDGVVDSSVEGVIVDSSGEGVIIDSSSEEVIARGSVEGVIVDSNGEGLIANGSSEGVIVDGSTAVLVSDVACRDVQALNAASTPHTSVVRDHAGGELANTALATGEPPVMPFLCVQYLLAQLPRYAQLPR
jgi:hypothetical protein